MDDEYLFSMRPYRPLDAPSTPISNSPSSLSSHQELWHPPTCTGSPSRGASPDITSSPSEPSRRLGSTPPCTPTRSPPPPQIIRGSAVQPPEPADSEARPGPEDAEGSTRRWSFRSRKANQLQPYRFDRLQYKRQLRGIPDAVVTALSPPRRRSSPESTTDQDFIADNEEDTQETGELSGCTIAREDGNQFQSGDSYRPRPSSRATPPALPPPQWFLDGMNEISDVDDDDDVVGYLAGYSRKKPATTEVGANDKAVGVSHNLRSGILRNLMHWLECRGTKKPAKEEAQTAP